MPIPTPFSYPVVSTTGICAQEPDIEYTPYDLFALYTQILPHLQDIFGLDVDIQFPATPINDRMVVMLVPTIGGEYISITKSQEEQASKIMQQILTRSPKLVLLYSWKNTTTDDNGNPLSLNFVKQMLPFVTIDPSGYYDSFSTPGEGVANLTNEQYQTRNLPPVPGIIGDFGILINLEGYGQGTNQGPNQVTKVPSYLQMYNYLVTNVRNQLVTMHNVGWILVDNNNPIVNNWNLEPLDVDQTLHQPTWQDDRFASSMQDFLLSRLLGSTEIRIQLPTTSENKWQTRDKIARSIPGVFFQDSFAITNANNLREARSIANSIDTIVASNIPNVEFIINPNQEQLQELQQDNVVYYYNGMVVYSHPV